MEVKVHDLLILGTGIAGLRAAVEASRTSGGELDIALISKTQLVRPHSLCAEGGTGAVIHPEEGDSLELARLGHGQGQRFPGRPGCGHALRGDHAQRDHPVGPLGRTMGKAVRRPD